MDFVNSFYNLMTIFFAKILLVHQNVDKVQAKYDSRAQILPTEG